MLLKMWINIIAYIVMESIEVLKKLGNGVLGTVYLIKINGKKYIAKIEKISENEIKYNTSYTLWREIDFSKFTAKYPDYFMTLKSWTITNNCQHTQPTANINNTKIKNQLEKKNKSTKCSILIYDPVLDDTLKNFYEKLYRAPTAKNYKIFYSMFCQMLNIFNLLIKNKYLHRDAHPGNIMYKKTTDKFIKLGNTDVPTFGYNWFLIDYGYILHNDYKITPSEKKNLKDKFSDIMTFIYTSILMPIWNVESKHGFKFESWPIMVKKVHTSNEYNNIKQFLPNISNKKILQHCGMLLFLLHYPIKYHSFMNIDVIKYKQYILNYDNVIPFYIQIIKNLNNPMKNINWITKTYLN